MLSTTTLPRQSAQVEGLRRRGSCPLSSSGPCRSAGATWSTRAVAGDVALVGAAPVEPASADASSRDAERRGDRASDGHRRAGAMRPRRRVGGAHHAPATNFLPVAGTGSRSRAGSL